MEHSNIEYYLFNINEKLKYKHKALFHSLLGSFLVGIVYFLEIYMLAAILTLIYFILILVNIAESTQDFEYKVKTTTTKRRK